MALSKAARMHAHKPAATGTSKRGKKRCHRRESFSNSVTFITSPDWLYQYKCNKLLTRTVSGE